MSATINFQSRPGWPTRPQLRNVGVLAGGACERAGAKLAPALIGARNRAPSAECPILNIGRPGAPDELAPARVQFSGLAGARVVGERAAERAGGRNS